MSSSGGSKGKSKAEEENLIGWEVHGFKTLDEIAFEKIAKSAAEACLDGNTCLAILYNAERYIERYPRIMVDELTSPAEILAAGVEGLIFLCRKGEQDAQNWDLVEAEVDIYFDKPDIPGTRDRYQRDVVPLLKMKANYTIMLAKFEVTLLCYGDYKIVQYRKNDDEEKKQKIQLMKGIAKLGTDVDKYADAVDKLRGKGSGSKVSK